MGTMVGLYGNPILQAKSLAKLIDMDNEGDLGDLLALTRGCIIAVEETTESEEYKIEATLSFEGAGKQFYTMKYINDILEDIIEMNAINDKFDLYSILMEIEKMLDYTNPYLVKLERKVRQNKFTTPFNIERDENGNIKDNVVFDMSGAVFIDEVGGDKSQTTTKVGTYKDYGPKK